MTTHPAIIRHHTRCRRKKSKGQVEILSTTLGRSVAVIGVISVLAVGVFVYNDMQEMAIENEVNVLIGAVDKFFAAQGTYQSMTTRVMVDSLTIPKVYLQDQGGWLGIATPWHSSIWIDWANNPLSNVQYAAWTMTIFDVPTAQCVQLSTRKFQSQIGMTYGMTTANIQTHDIEGTFSADYKPYSASDAILMCSNNGSSSGNISMQLAFN